MTSLKLISDKWIHINTIGSEQQHLQGLWSSVDEQIIIFRAIFEFFVVNSSMSMDCVDAKNTRFKAVTNGIM